MADASWPIAIKGFIQTVAEKRSTDVSDVDLLVNIGKVAIYFILLFLTWGHTWRDMFRSGAKRYPVLSLILFVASIWNVVEAWRLIYAWLRIEYLEAAAAGGEEFRWDEWFVDMDLFTKAYVMVVATFQQWVWSSQLLHFVSSLVVFTYAEFYRSNALRPASNFWLGCAAGISLSFPNALHVVLNGDPMNRRMRWYVPVSKLLIVCVVVANLAVLLLPRVDRDGFAPVLATLHISLCIPLLASQWMPREFFRQAKTESERRVGGWWLVPLYGALAGISMTAHAFNLLTAMSSLDPMTGERPTAVLGSILSAFCANECQCSISNDVLRTSVIFMVVVLWAGEGIPLKYRFLLAILTPILSVGTTFPIWAAWRELNLHLFPYTYLERIHRMLLVYQPDHSTLATAQKIANSAKGREDILIRQMVKKFGAEPFGDPPQVEPEFLAAGGSRTPQVTPPPAVVRQTGPPATAAEAQVLKKRLIRFYLFHDMPGKIADIEKILGEWGASPAALFDALNKKYGPEPPSKWQPTEEQLAAAKIRRKPKQGETPPAEESSASKRKSQSASPRSEGTT